MTHRAAPLDRRGAGEGNQLTLEAHALLRGAELRFDGNTEGRGLLEGDADIVVCDGFTGNVALKTLEGPSAACSTRCAPRSARRSGGRSEGC